MCSCVNCSNANTSNNVPGVIIYQYKLKFNYCPRLLTSVLRNPYRELSVVVTSRRGWLGLGKDILRQVVQSWITLKRILYPFECCPGLHHLWCTCSIGIIPILHVHRTLLIFCMMKAAEIFHILTILAYHYHMDAHSRRPAD